MKLNLTLVVAGIGLLVAGCASQQGMVLEAVGPGPAAAVNADTANGTLVVYSAAVTTPDFNSRDPRRPEYTGYQIFNTDGSLRQTVQNTSDTILQRPRRVELPPGTYRVAAVANGYGLVTVPVRIEAGRDTLVHLEGGFAWPGRTTFSQSNTVRLPDGDVVGWKSEAAGK